MKTSPVSHPVLHGLRLLGGWGFLVLGVLGLFLPILQGLIFLAIGIVLLAPYSPFFRRLQSGLYRRFPRMRRLVRHVRARRRRYRPGRTQAAAGQKPETDPP